MTQHYDIIIIGSGPNGLAIGAYLSKAGQKVLLLEKRFEAGGGLATEQVTLPDFFHDTHSMFHMMVDYAPVYDDFQFEEKWGVQHIYPELQSAMPLSDGRCICLYQDVEKTCSSISQFSKKDAESYRDIYHQYNEMMKHILGPQTYVPMDPAPIMAAKAQETELGRELSELTEKTPQEIVYDLFEDEYVRLFMLYHACHWGLDYTQSGVSYMVPLYLNRMVNYRLTAGGSHRVSNAMLKQIFEHQGQIRTSAQIERIIMENGEAKGVVLDDGTQYMADKAVVSTIDPHQTFLKYVEADHLEPDFVEMIENYHWEKWSFLQIQLALAEPPQFKAAEKNPDINKAFLYIIGYETLSDLTGQWDTIFSGEIPEKAGYNCCFPSIHDPFQAPSGRANCTISQMMPYDLNDGGSDRWLSVQLKEELTERQIIMLQKYAPNLTRDKILYSYTVTPADIQNKYANMEKGSYKQGAYHPLQMGYLRPNQDCSHYRTPVKNLYVGGASVSPGGMVIWGPGYNCANAICEDFGIEKWWTEPEYVSQARENGYI